MEKKGNRRLHIQDVWASCPVCWCSFQVRHHGGPQCSERCRVLSEIEHTYDGRVAIHAVRRERMDERIDANGRIVEGL